MPNNKYTHRLVVREFVKDLGAYKITISQEEFLFLNEILYEENDKGNVMVIIEHIDSQNEVLEEIYHIQGDNPHIILKEKITQLLIQFHKSQGE